jgi:hypothetical protein
MKGASFPRNRFKTALIQWFDILFVMGLCFITMLATMKSRGAVLVGAGAADGLDYSFSLPVFVLVIAILGGYLWYLIAHSEKELQDMVDHVYGPAEKDKQEGGDQ